PRLVAARPVGGPALPLETLVDRIETSADRPYHGYAEGRGALRLPELPGAADLGTLMSDTSRMRLWYDGPDRWGAGRHVGVGFGHAPVGVRAGRDPAAPSDPHRPHAARSGPPPARRRAT